MEYDVAPLGGPVMGRWCAAHHACSSASALQSPERHLATPAGSTHDPATPCLQGCKCLIAIERAKLELGKPDPDSAYWN